MSHLTQRVQPPLTDDCLQAHWTELNVRFFRSALPPISIEWSRRLTSSVGLFSSRVGPRSLPLSASAAPRRQIRLSLPLLGRLADATAFAEQEIVNTLAHEMIHQWQYDVLKRRPDHGLDFLRKMTEMNRSGLVGVTLYHGLNEQVRAVARYQWRCQQCGRDYHRSRRTIREQRHRCGACRGRLVGVAPAQPADAPPASGSVMQQVSLSWFRF